jgi:hypothetical protein
MWLAFLLVGLLLGWDWVVKRRRTVRRAEMDDEEFLRAYGTSGESVDGAEILEVRGRIAREFGLPVCKLTPNDPLAELCDRFSLVGNGDLALTDLLDDLIAAGRGAVTGEPPPYPETVRDYIEAFLERSRVRPSTAEQ